MSVGNTSNIQNSPPYYANQIFGWTSLRVPELKKILATLNLPRSGLKADLTRTLEEYYRNANEDQRVNFVALVKQQYDLIMQGRGRVLNANYIPTPNNPHVIDFRSKPVPVPNSNINMKKLDDFELEIQEDICFETVKMLDKYSFGTSQPLINFQLAVEASDREMLNSKNNSDYSLAIGCGKSVSTGEKLIIQYPMGSNLSFNQSYVNVMKINETYAQQPFMPHDRKPVTGKPAVVSGQLVRNVNTLKLTWNHNNSNNSEYIIFAYIRKKLPNTSILLKLKETQLKSKEDLIASQFGKEEVDEDLITGPEVISLRDPITRARLKLPGRGKNCRHLQCFDCETYLTICNSEEYSKKECPVCYSILPISEIFVDGYVLDILQNTPVDCDTVQVEQDGVWRIPESIKFMEQKSNTNDKKRSIELDNSPGSDRKKQKQEPIIICLSDTEDEALPVVEPKNINTEPEMAPPGVIILSDSVIPPYATEEDWVEDEAWQLELSQL